MESWDHLCPEGIRWAPKVRLWSCWMYRVWGQRARPWVYQVGSLTGCPLPSKGAVPRGFRLPCEWMRGEPALPTSPGGCEGRCPSGTEEGWVVTTGWQFHGFIAAKKQTNQPSILNLDWSGFKLAVSLGSAPKHTSMLPGSAPPGPLRSPQQGSRSQERVNKHSSKRALCIRISRSNKNRNRDATTSDSD